MNQYARTMITLGVLVFVIFGLYYFTGWFSRTTGYVLGEDEKFNLAICLKGKGTIFYVSNTCPDCDKQLNLFGKDASRMLNVFVCKNADECPQGGVPAWKIGKQVHYGVKQLDELINISECDVD
jgi:hypothetical protein